MSDLKLFHIQDGAVAEIFGQAVQVERSLQNLCEQNLEALLGVRFLASEYSTGPVHGGRIDTLGLDEDGSPVIIEYKRSVNENVINQGLFYLDWLLDHKKEFQWLVMERFGADAAKAVDWSGPRLLCIAGDFTKYDGHAVNQIARNIELLRYRRFGDQFLLLELVHAPKYARTVSVKEANVGAAGGIALAVGPDVGTNGASETNQSSRISYRIEKASPSLRDLLEAVRSYLLSLGDDVQQKELQHYIAFKRIKNFACVEIYPKAQTVTVYLKIDPMTVELEPGLTRDVRKIGHLGTGDLEVSMTSLDDFARAQALFQRAYERG